MHSQVKSKTTDVDDKNVDEDGEEIDDDHPEVANAKLDAKKAAKAKKAKEDAEKAAAKKAAVDKARYESVNPFTGNIHHSDGSQEHYPTGGIVGGANSQS